MHDTTGEHLVAVGNIKTLPSIEIDFCLGGIFFAIPDFNVSRC